MTQNNIEDLLAELGRRNEELVLAAGYGKALLEEKEQLRESLEAAQEEIKQLEERLHSLRQESQRTLSLTQAKADDLVSELEGQLQTANKNLQEEQNRHRNSKEEYQKALVSLHTENSKLRVEINLLSNEKDKENDRVRKVSDALKQSEAEGQVAHLQQEELEKLVETLQSTNHRYEDDLSTLTHTCDRLTEELQNARSQLESWEAKYTRLNDELLAQHKELQDSQEIVKELEGELERRRSTTGSPTSTMSLHDELSQSLQSLDLLPDVLEPVPESDTLESPSEADNFESPVEQDDLIPKDIQTHTVDQNTVRVRMVEHPSLSARRRSSEQSVTGTLRASDHPHVVMMWSSGSENTPSPCPRCQSLDERVEELRQELSTVSDQLLAAIQQKVKLQEQNEAWQNDMAELVEQNLHQKLDQEDTPTTPTKKPDKHRKSSSKRKQKSRENVDDVFRSEFIKKSWYF